MNLDLSELRDWKKFQNLIKLYFEKQAYTAEIGPVHVNASGVGTDDGKDLIVTLTIKDKVAEYQKKWVVQCKYYAETVNLKDIADENLPTLIHSYGATGYLLVVKENASAKLHKMFERLNTSDSLKLGYKYVVWEGEDIKNRIIPYPDLIEQFFPTYSVYLKSLNN